MNNYILIAGVNGTGKSSLRGVLEGQGVLLGHIIDADAIAKQNNFDNIKAGKELSITNEDDAAINVIDQPEKEDDSLMRRAFKCTNIGYDSYGRVNSIKFEEKQWGDLY